MLHKISNFCDRIKTIHEQAEKLRSAKYNLKLPKEKIDVMVEDIQFQMYLLSNDKEKYK